jgi:hypothetical protein
MWGQKRLHLVSGKTLLSRLSAWTQEKYETSIGAMAITRAFQQNEIPQEIREIICLIEDGVTFT